MGTSCFLLFVFKVQVSVSGDGGQRCVDSYPSAAPLRVVVLIHRDKIRKIQEA